MRFVTAESLRPLFEGKRVAIVGSGPSVTENLPNTIDSHDVVVRVNNYKIVRNSGGRTDVHYSFYGNSIRKSSRELQADGVKLCMCKCPNSRPIESAWHVRNGKVNGIDFRYIYTSRAGWWFCDTFIPSDSAFLEKFNLLEGHIPTTGFAAILDVLSYKPRRVYLTGFDFFTSGIHNVTEKWRPGDPSDPIGHRPESEASWILRNISELPIRLDPRLNQVLSSFREPKTGAVA